MSTGQSSSDQAPSGGERGLSGHRATPLRASPFGRNAAAIGVAIAFGVLSIIWLVAGDSLPGGRWLVTHLFTLGVLSVLIWSFSRNFAARFTGAGDLRERPATTRALTALLAISIAVMITGRATHAHWPLVIGTVGILLVVGANVVTLRRLRYGAKNERFVWVVRRYEDAHLVFLVAAALGGSLGAGWVPAEVFLAVRNAHIHLNVLGWAGLTVLTTLVVFGPALLRVRIEPGAEQRASAALQRAVFGLGMAALGLVLSGIGESVGDGAEGPARLLLVLGMAVYLQAVVVVAMPLLRAVRGHDRSALRWGIAASVVWFPVAIVVDTVLIMVGQAGWSVGLAVTLLVGVLAQLILTVLLHVAPMLRGRDFAGRDRIIARTERLPRTRTAVLNLGVAVLLVAEVLPSAAAPAVAVLAPTGWALVIVAVVAHLAIILWPVGASDPQQVRSAAAGRYRDRTG